MAFFLLVRLLNLPFVSQAFKNISYIQVFNILTIMGRYQKGQSASHSPPSPLSPGSFPFDNPSQWLETTVCYILEGLGSLVLFRLRFLIIIALLLIITSGIFTLQPVRSSSDHDAVWWLWDPAMALCC